MILRRNFKSNEFFFVDDTMLFSVVNNPAANELSVEDEF